MRIMMLLSEFAEDKKTAVAYFKFNLDSTTYTITKIKT
jgi:hypothetical protein